MKKIIVLMFALASLSGCASWDRLSDPEKAAIIVAGTLLVVGAVVANNSGDTIVVQGNGCHHHPGRSPEWDCPPGGP